jgi:hypothetical protein
MSFEIKFVEAHDIISGWHKGRRVCRVFPRRRRGEKGDGTHETEGDRLQLPLSLPLSICPLAS